MCQVVGDAGADYIKTSTGFSKAGATFEDIELFSEHVSERVKIKAAGASPPWRTQSVFSCWERTGWEPAEW